MSYYIGPRCSACHYCFNECPVGAIRFAGINYEIDEFKCIGCGKCAEVCPSGIIYDPENPETVTPHAPVEKECDLVVLGAGGSGLVAAVRAAQQSGKKVIVVEKAKKIGGNTTLGHGFMMRYTKWHEAAGLPDTREESINSLYERSGTPIFTDLILNNPDGYIIFLAKMMYLGNCTPASEHPARLDPRNTLENELQMSVKDVWYPENRGIGYTCYGDMTAEESEIYAAKAGDIATYLEEYMAKVIEGTEDINATYDTMIQTCYDLGLQEVLDIKQAAHDRYLAR